jgi:hypothetical protein
MLLVKHRTHHSLEILYNDTDKLLFAAATTITIGDDARTSFWHCAWARGDNDLRILYPTFLRLLANEKRLHSLYVFRGLE